MAEDLIDIATMSGYFRLNPWEKSVALGDKYGVQIFAGLSETRLRDADAAKKRRTIECYRGRAMNAWAAGVDGIYTFNYFNPNGAVFRELGDPKTLTTMDKLYTTGARTVGVANHWLAGGIKHCTRPLPLPEKPLALSPKKPVAVALNVGEDIAEQIAAGNTPKTKLTLVISGTKNVDSAAFTVKMNGKTLGDATVSKNELAYSIPASAVKKGANQFQATGPKGAKLNDLLLSVDY